MRDPEVIAAMAEASLLNGASGVRLESPEHIGAVRRRCPEALIIGLWKRTFPDSSVYITPGWHEMEMVWAAGASVVALDATARPRPQGQSLEALIQRAKRELGAPLMADIDSVANGLRAAQLGCPWVGRPSRPALVCHVQYRRASATRQGKLFVEKRVGRPWRQEPVRGCQSVQLLPQFFKLVHCLLITRHTRWA